MLERDGLDKIRATDIMTRSPKTIHPTEMAVNALGLMRQYEITHLPVTEGGRYVGMIQLHDLVKEGLI